jgi:hypothetical protein
MSTNNNPIEIPAEFREWAEKEALDAYDASTYQKPLGKTMWLLAAEKMAEAAYRHLSSQSRGTGGTQKLRNALELIVNRLSPIRSEKKPPWNLLQRADVPRLSFGVSQKPKDCALKIILLKSFSNDPSRRSIFQSGWKLAKKPRTVNKTE